MQDDQVEQDLRDILGSFEITNELDRTLLIAVVIAKDPSLNTNQKIGCYHGTPIKGYAFSVKDDAYLIPCVEAKELGWINQTFFIGIPFTGNWKLPLPLPPKVIERYLTAAQKKLIKEMRDKYSSESHDLHFVQMQGCDK